jgi:hypothetical protein
MTDHWTRREVMTAAGATVVAATLPPLSRALAASPASSGWNDGFDAGPLQHILPLVSHERILLKTSFHQAPDFTPSLSIDGRASPGRKVDRHGKFWNFDVAGLKPATSYELRLVDDTGKGRSGAWPLKTFPAPDAAPGSVRLLVYTCSGGMPDIVLPDGRNAFLTHEIRQRLLARGLSFSPRAVIANGDHIYWDQTSFTMRHADELKALFRNLVVSYGRFDTSIPVLDTENEDILVRVANRQIAELYGTRLRSTPAFFITDDHDYFENDEAHDQRITFPPDHFMLQLARAKRLFYYGEFILGPHQPTGLPGASAADRSPGLSETYGLLRYGKLLETLLYDTRRFSTLKGPSAVLVAETAEEWITARTLAEDDARHLIHVPSHPFGWSAGKWMEWYPDVLNDKGELTDQKPKPYWQKGWHAQHQRLLSSLSAQKRRPAFIISGDLHMVGAGKILGSGDIDFSAHPITSMVSGPISTGDTGWPSLGRGTIPKIARNIKMETLAAIAEKNGFAILDVTSDRIDVRLFAWRTPTPVEAIDTMEPYATFSVGRRS